MKKNNNKASLKLMLFVLLYIFSALPHIAVAMEPQKHNKTRFFLQNEQDWQKYAEQLLQAIQKQKDNGQDIVALYNKAFALGGMNPQYKQDALDLIALAIDDAPLATLLAIQPLFMVDAGNTQHAQDIQKRIERLQQSKNEELKKTATREAQKKQAEADTVLCEFLETIEELHEKIDAAKNSYQGDSFLIRLQQDIDLTVSLFYDSIMKNDQLPKEIKSSAQQAVKKLHDSLCNFSIDNSFSEQIKKLATITSEQPDSKRENPRNQEEMRTHRIRHFTQTKRQSENAEARTLIKKPCLPGPSNSTTEMLEQSTPQTNNREVTAPGISQPRALSWITRNPLLTTTGIAATIGIFYWYKKNR